MTPGQRAHASGAGCGCSDGEFRVDRGRRRWRVGTRIPSGGARAGHRGLKGKVGQTGMSLHHPLASESDWSVATGKSESLPVPPWGVTAVRVVIRVLRHVHGVVAPPLQAAERRLKACATTLITPLTHHCHRGASGGARRRVNAARRAGVDHGEILCTATAGGYNPPTRPRLFPPGARAASYVPPGSSRNGADCLCERIES